jgi:hypothetical protein
MGKRDNGLNIVAVQPVSCQGVSQTMDIRESATRCGPGAFGWPLHQTTAPVGTYTSTVEIVLQIWNGTKQKFERKGLTLQSNECVNGGGRA